MKPWRVGVVVGLLACVASLAIMYAGSDHPPPPGFIVVAGACGALGVLMGGLVPFAARMRQRGRSGFAIATFAGSSAAFVVLVAALLTVANGGTAGAGGIATFLAVAACAGALGGLTCGALALGLLRLTRTA